MKIQDIEGKTIRSAQLMQDPEHSDKHVFRLTFTDDAACDIVATHSGDWDTEAIDEYAALIFITPCDDSLVPVNNTEGDAE